MHLRCNCAHYGGEPVQVLDRYARLMLGVALLPILTSPGRLSSKIDQRWFGVKSVDSATRELAIGFFATALFALALVAFQNRGR
jgi:hypothetical protein